LASIPAFTPPRAEAAGALAAGADAADWLLSPDPPREAQPAVASATAAVTAQTAADELILILIECSSF
jgi:hypothetical protein